MAGRSKPHTSRGGEGTLVWPLHHGRPNVVEELNFPHRLQTAEGHSTRAANNVGFSEWRIENSRRAELTLQTRSRFENAALPFHQRETVFSAAIGHILAKHYDAVIGLHFVEKCGGKHFD